MTEKAGQAAERRQGLGYLLARVHHQFRNEMTVAADAFGLNLGQFLVMSSVASHPDTGVEPLTQTRLGALTELDKSTLVILLDSLELKELVRRERHPTDRRARVVRLTAKGLDLLALAAPALRRRETELLADFSDEEVSVLRGLLVRLLGRTRHLSGNVAGHLSQSAAM